MLKVLCKRSLFERNTNYYKINGKDYGEVFLKWAVDKFYEARVPEDYEINLDIVYYIESEVDNQYFPIRSNDFNKHFYSPEELRNQRIDDLISSNRYCSD